MGQKAGLYQVLGSITVQLPHGIASWNIHWPHTLKEPPQCLSYFIILLKLNLSFFEIAFIYLPKASIGHKLFDRVGYIPSTSFCTLSEQEEAWHIGIGQ